MNITRLTDYISYLLFIGAYIYCKVNSAPIQINRHHFFPVQHISHCGRKAQPHATIFPIKTRIQIEPQCFRQSIHGVT